MVALYVPSEYAVTFARHIVRMIARALTTGVIAVVVAYTSWFVFESVGTDEPESNEWNRYGLSFGLPSHFAPISAESRRMQLPVGDQRLSIAGSDVYQARFGFPSGLGANVPSDTEVVLDVAIRDIPGWNNPGLMLSLLRRLQYGASYRAWQTDVVVLAERPWWRARFSYRYDDGHRVAPERHVWEYAVVQRDRLFSIRLDSRRDMAAALADSVVAEAMLTASDVHAPDWQTVRHLDRIRSMLVTTDKVNRTATANVAILVGDVNDAFIHVVSGGSGTVVQTNGAILTNLHVVRDEVHDRLHDVFIVGRVPEVGQRPAFFCLGRPDKDLVDIQADLALVRCSHDLDGNTWRTPAWPPVRVPTVASERDDQRPVYILGYPDTHDGHQVLRPGTISGWSVDLRNPGYGYWQTQADISPGLSGGTVLDSQGVFVAVPSAYRLRATRVAGDEPRIERVGLMRPVSQARTLMSTAARKWNIKGNVP